MHAKMTFAYIQTHFNQLCYTSAPLVGHCVTDYSEMCLYMSNYRSLLENIVSFIGLFYKRDLMCLYMSNARQADF